MTPPRRVDTWVRIMGWTALILFESAGPLRAGTINLPAISASTRISELYTKPPTETLTQQSVWFGGAVWLLSSGGIAGTPTDAAFKFDLSSIPQGATIDSATFTFSIAGSQSGGAGGAAGLDVWGGAGSYSSAMNLSDFPSPGYIFPPGFGIVPYTVATIGSPYPIPSDSAIGSVEIPISIDVTTIVQSLAGSNTPFAVFGMDAGGNVAIWSSEATTFYPVLTINSPSVPEPSGALLLGLGLGGVLVVAWRRSGNPR